MMRYRHGRPFTLDEFTAGLFEILPRSVNDELGNTRYPDYHGQIHIVIEPHTDEEADYLKSLVDKINLFIGGFDVRRPLPGEVVEQFCTFGPSVTLPGSPVVLEIIIEHDIIENPSFKIRMLLAELKLRARALRRAAQLQTAS